MAKIGVFWVIDGEKIDGYRESLDCGEDYGDTIQPTFDHFSYWEKLILRYPKLKILEYDDIPRGRVVYNKKEKHFLILSSKEVLENKKLIKAISQFLKLRKSPNSYVWDEHYEINRSPHVSP